MSPRVLAFALVCGLSACAPPAREASLPPPAAGPDAEREVAHVLDDWHDAAARVDLARYFGHLADDSVFLGTDAAERWSKGAFLAYARPHFARGKAWTFRARRRAIVIAPGGALAWFDEDLETLGLGPARGSGVLARRAGRFQILQYNLTITVPNDRFDVAREAAGAAALLAAPEGDPVARLGWLSGAWVGTTPAGERVEESWLPPGGATMVGSGRSTKQGETVFFELLRVVVRDGKLVYVAQPFGRPPTEFTEVAGRPADEIVFENRAHDWPKRITYRRKGPGLEVRVEGDAGQPAEAWTMEPAVVARSARPGR